MNAMLVPEWLFNFPLLMFVLAYVVKFATGLSFQPNILSLVVSFLLCVCFAPTWEVPPKPICEMVNEPTQVTGDLWVLHYDSNACSSNPQSTNCIH